MNSSDKDNMKTTVDKNTDDPERNKPNQMNPGSGYDNKRNKRGSDESQEPSAPRGPNIFNILLIVFLITFLINTFFLNR